MTPSSRRLAASLGAALIAVATAMAPAAHAADTKMKPHAADTMQPADAMAPDAMAKAPMGTDAMKPADAMAPDGAMTTDAMKPDAMQPDAMKPDAMQPDAMAPDAMAATPMTPKAK